MTEDEAIAEDEAAFLRRDQTVMVVPGQRARERPFQADGPANRGAGAIRKEAGTASATCFEKGTKT